MGLYEKSEIAENHAIKYNYQDPDELENQIKNIVDQGDLYTRNEDYASAKEQYDSAFEILKKMEFYPLSYNERYLLYLSFRIIFSLSNMYYFKGDIALALDGKLQGKHLVLQAREFDTRANPELVIYDVKELISVNLGIALCYRDSKDYQNSLKYASEALVQCTEATKTWGILELADNYYYADLAMALILDDMGEQEKALTYCRNFLNICEMLPEYLKTKEGMEKYKWMTEIHNEIKETVTDT